MRLTTNYKRNGKTPLELCLSSFDEFENDNIIEYNKKIGVLKSIINAPDPPSDLSNKLNETIKTGNLINLAALLRAGANINCFDQAGMNLLENAFEELNFKLAEIIVRESKRLDNYSLCLALFYSATSGNLTIAQIILKRGCRADIKFDDDIIYNGITKREFKFLSSKTEFFWTGGTALHYAAKSSIEMTKLLLKYGANPNIKDHSGNTPLHIAAMNSDKISTKTITLLLKNKADPYILDSNGFTPMHLLVSRHYGLNTLQVFFDHGVDINFTNSQNETLLDTSLSMHSGFTQFSIEDKFGFVLKLFDIGIKMKRKHPIDLLKLAVKTKEIGNIQKLLRRGINLNVCDNYGNNVLHYLYSKWSDTQLGSIDIQSAVAKSNFLFRALLAEGIDITFTDYEERTALHYMTNEGDKKAIKIIIDTGANPNAQTVSGITPLMECRTADVFNLLISNGADPNDKDSFGYSVYDRLTIGGFKEAAECLTKIVPDIKLGLHASFILALENNDLKTVRLLLDNQLDPNFLNHHGNPVLFTSIDTGNLQLIGELLKRGANIEARNKIGLTPLGYALNCLYKKETSRIVSFLLDHGASILNVDSRGNSAAFSIRTFIPNNERQLIRRLWENCLFERSENDDTLLHMAAKFGLNQEISWLIKKGVDANHQNENGDTPLHIICSSFCKPIDKYYKSANTLIYSGAKVNISNNSGCTPLHLAIEKPLFRKIIKERFPLIMLLVKHGANPKAMDKHNFTPIDYAFNCRDVNGLRLLLNKTGYLK